MPAEIMVNGGDRRGSKKDWQYFEYPVMWTENSVVSAQTMEGVKAVL